MLWQIYPLMLMFSAFGMRAVLSAVLTMMSTDKLHRLNSASAALYTNPESKGLYWRATTRSSSDGTKQKIKEWL